MSRASINATRWVIINADDLGLSQGVNAGIITAHERGIVTSASLMVRRAGAEDAAQYARVHPSLSVGLHVDFGEWRRDESGQWHKDPDATDTDDPRAVHAELLAQLDQFRRLTGRNPTHLDSHQHAHREGHAMNAVLEAGARLGVPVRHFCKEVSYCGNFYGQGPAGEAYPDLISPEALMALLRSLPQGITELACHPGDDPALESDYRDERRREMLALTDARIRLVLQQQGITLCSFATAPLPRRSG